MSGYDWTPYLTGGGTRADALSGLDQKFLTTLSRLHGEAPEEIRRQLRIGSGYRSPERQQELWDAAAPKYPDPEVRDNWVARPGQSNHGRGMAVDFNYGNDEARAYAHANAKRYGLYFPMDHEPWHIEMMGARGDHSGAGLGDDARMPAGGAGLGDSDAPQAFSRREQWMHDKLGTPLYNDDGSIIQGRWKNRADKWLNKNLGLPMPDLSAGGVKTRERMGGLSSALINFGQDLMG